MKSCQRAFTVVSSVESPPGTLRNLISRGYRLIGPCQLAGINFYDDSATSCSGLLGENSRAWFDWEVSLFRTQLGSEVSDVGLGKAIGELEMIGIHLNGPHQFTPTRRAGSREPRSQTRLTLQRCRSRACPVLTGKVDLIGNGADDHELRVKLSAQAADVAQIINLRFA